MKTAMQELIEWCNSCLTDLTLSDGAKTALEVTITRATDLLEKEKEQIIDAYDEGIINGEANEDGNGKMFYNLYYNQTYNNEQ